MIKVALITAGVIVVFFVALFLYGWWLLNHEKPTDLWTGKEIDHEQQ